jgi:ferredoxin-NADP reductase
MRIAHQHECCEAPMKLLYSVKSHLDMAYKYELFPSTGASPDDVIMTFTGRAPEGWHGYARRIDTVMIDEVLQSFEAKPRAYVCGPTPMVEAVTQLLVQAGLDPEKISAERFGSTA